VVAVAVFLVIIIGVYNAYKAVYDVVSVSRFKIVAVDLANERFEIIRNMPYSSVGTVSGIPNGVLNHEDQVTRDGQVFDITTTIRNYDDPFDGTLGGNPNDISPADSKIVEVRVDCQFCKSFKPIVLSGRVSPKNLETASTNGALFVKVFDSSGNPVSGADIHIENNNLIPPVSIDDVTNNSGVLAVVDVPPDSGGYQISATKSGFTTDTTASSTVSNPNPTKPNATVLLQQVTTQSLIIDRLSTPNFSSKDPSCSSVSSIDFNMKGSKTIGDSPVIYKYNQNKVTNGSGLLTLSSVEWDTYNISLIDSLYDLAGTNTLLPINVYPGETKDVDLIVVPKNPNSLLVIVKDAVTLLPLSDVNAELLLNDDVLYTGLTGKGFLGQSDWSLGSGQATSTNLSKYFSSDGNIETSNPVGDLKLDSVFGNYESGGYLISSSFDTGGFSNFKDIIWSPLDQATSTGDNSVKFQIATNSDGATWNFTGPDGTSGTFYTASNRNIHSSNDNKRFLRYKIFLSTEDTNFSPNVSNVAFTFNNSCTPPGQMFFNGLSSGTYKLKLSKSGYTPQEVNVSISSPWKSQEIILMPE
jgi:hypothetical protein